MDAVPKALALRERALAFTFAPTFREVLDSRPAFTGVIRSRYYEICIPVDEQAFLAEYPDPLNCLLLITEESPDTAVIMPLLQRAIECAPRLELRILRDDDELELFSQLIDDVDLDGDLADWDLPLLLILDEDWQIQAQWGPRPQAVESQLDRWLAGHPDYEELAESDDDDDQESYATLLENLTLEMRVWYNTDMDRECLAEIHAILVSLQDDDDDNGDEDDDDGNTTFG